MSYQSLAGFLPVDWSPQGARIAQGPHCYGLPRLGAVANTSAMLTIPKLAQALAKTGSWRGFFVD